MRRDINFFNVYRSPLDNNSNGKDPVTIVGTIVICVCIVAVLSVFGYIKMNDAVQTVKINEYTSYLRNGNVLSAQNTVSSVTNKINAINQYENAVSGAYGDYQKLPVPVSNLINLISKAIPGDVTVTNITYSSSVVSLQCVSVSAQSPEIFAHALKATEGFENVVYKGYSINDKNQYDFKLTFTVKEGSSK